MIIKKINDVPNKPVVMDGAKDASVRVLFGPAENAPTFAMRIFELAPGGNTPLHSHDFEHQIMVLEGDIALVGDSTEDHIAVGDVAMIMPNDRHQFRNMSDTHIARFMCLVPVAYQK